MLAASPAQAQQVLVQGNVANDTLPATFGPNRRYFLHLYAAGSLVAGPAETGAAVRYGLPSAEWQIGLRLKRRFTQTLALNLDLRYAYLRYALVQNGQKTLPDARQHDKETLGLHLLQLEPSLRLNAGRRGNIVGRYLDLLAWGGPVLGSRHVVEDEPAPGVSQVETIESGLPYVRRWAGGVGLRLGLDRYAFTARYRLSPSFTPAYAAWPELPRGTVGLEIGLF